MVEAIGRIHMLFDGGDFGRHGERIMPGLDESIDGYSGAELDLCSERNSITELYDGRRYQLIQTRPMKVHHHQMYRSLVAVF